MSTNAPRNRAALYLRLSDDKQATGDNVADQERAARKIATKNGWDIVAVYSDNDRPASEPKKKPRPAFERMLEDAAHGRFDHLLIRHADRLYRTAYDQGRIAEVFGPRKIVIHQEWAGYPLDLSTPTGVLTAGIMAQVAQYETDHKKERQRAMNRQHVAKGEPRKGGRIPFGYTEDRKTPDPVQAQMVRDAHTALLRGASLGSIIRQWNDSGVTAPRGGRWSYATVRNVLVRPLNAGLVFYDGHVLPGVKGTWEPLVTEEQHHAVVNLLRDPARRTTDPGPSRRKHLLAGIARCGSCGQPLKSGATWSRGKKSPLYRCANKECPKRVHVHRDRLNEHVVERFLAERGALGWYRLIPVSGHDAQSLADVEARIRSTSARLAEDEADVPALLVRLEELKAERAKVRQAPAFPRYEGGTVAEEWAKATTLTDAAEAVAGQQALLRRHLGPNGIQVSVRGDVTHRFDPARVSIEWLPVREYESGAVSYSPASADLDLGSIPA